MSQSGTAKGDKEKGVKQTQPGRRAINKAGSNADQTPKQNDQTPVHVSSIIKDSVDDELADESMWKPLNIKNGDIPKPRPAMKGGWSDNRASRRALDDPDDDRRLHMTDRRDVDVDSDPDIPMIPELEDTQLATSRDEHVVLAPLVAVNRVTTYKELDNELTKHVPFLSLDNEIDLKLLSRGLCTEAELREDDVPWEWDQLFTEVTSELTAEWDQQEQLEDKFSAALSA